MVDKFPFGFCFGSGLTVQEDYFSTRTTLKGQNFPMMVHPKIGIYLKINNLSIK